MPLTPSETKNLLDRLGHRPDKRLGQNFLIDGNLVRKSLSMAKLPERAQVVEVGPGLGSLTGALLDEGHQVHTVELDETLSEHLKKTFAEEMENGSFTLAMGDAVKMPFGKLPDESSEFHVVANLPYAISSPWLEAILSSQRLPQRLVLMLQKESADRYRAKAGSKNFGALSIFLAACYENVDTHSVSRRCFHPVPAVDSVLLRLDKLPQPFLFPDHTRSLIRSLFTRRRKQLASSAKSEKKESCERIFRWLEKEGISGKLRPEQVEAEKWKSL